MLVVQKFNCVAVRDYQQFKVWNVPSGAQVWTALPSAQVWGKIQCKLSADKYIGLVALQSGSNTGCLAK
jgi:hypothetical protein